MAFDRATRHDRSFAFGVRREPGIVRAGGRFCACIVSCFAALLPCMAPFLPSARAAEAPTGPALSVSDQLAGKPPDSITGNPAAENELPGTGLAGRLLRLPEDTGL